MKATERILRDLSMGERQGGRMPQPLIARWADKVLVGDDCWTWTGANNRGYGVTSVPAGDGRTRVIYAHRAAWMLFRGPLDDSLQVDHLCKNRKCVRPSHLEPVTPRENLRRSSAPMWVLHESGVCARGHPQTGENIKVRPNGHHWCRPCAKTWRRSA